MLLIWKLKGKKTWAKIGSEAHQGCAHISLGSMEVRAKMEKWKKIKNKWVLLSRNTYYWQILQKIIREDSFPSMSCFLLQRWSETLKKANRCFPKELLQGYNRISNRKLFSFLEVIRTDIICLSKAACLHNEKYM